MKLFSYWTIDNYRNYIGSFKVIYLVRKLLSLRSTTKETTKELRYWRNYVIDLPWLFCVFPIVQRLSMHWIHHSVFLQLEAFVKMDAVTRKGLTVDCRYFYNQRLDSLCWHLIYNNVSDTAKRPISWWNTL